MSATKPATRVVECPGGRFVECIGPLSQVDDALDLISACASHNARRLLIEARHLPADFFDLSTRFAGEFVQKMQNYGITMAAVLPADDGYSDRFKDFVAEARRGRQFRTFTDRADAESWLCT